MPTKSCVIHIVHTAKWHEAQVNLDVAACLEEAIGLALAIDLDVVHQQIIQLHKLVPATLLGQGNVQSLKAIIAAQDIKLVIIDFSLSPVQQRNLEKAWQCKVIDRTGLILEIFGERARTAEGRLQVELAALNYQRSRLVRTWTHLERQRGGFGFTGGPGESQLELDRRLIDERIIKITKELDQIKRTRSLHRKARKEVPYPVIALVGYTNAGKSTLFNRLTQAKVLAKDMLFATLDPTMRQVRLPSGRDVIVSDTVGFISNLPIQLVMAFRATLEEVCAADIILHVRDGAHPNSLQQALEVEKVLGELGLEEAFLKEAVINVYNKVDLLDLEQRRILANSVRHQSTSVLISAITGEGIDHLSQLIDQHLNRKKLTLEIDLPSNRGDMLAWLYRRGAIVDRYDHEDTIHLHLKISAEDYARFKSRFFPLS
jgi:GTP-binding protein HflX